MKKIATKAVAFLLVFTAVFSVFSVNSFATEKDSLKKENGIWYYMKDNKKDPSYTGLVKYYDTWYYVANGIVNWRFTGLTKYYDTWYYVSGGVLDFGVNTLTKLDGTWYCVRNGVLDFGYSGLTNYFGTWYYISGGVLDWNYIGLTKYYDTWYYVYKGILDWKANTLIKYYDTWYYVFGGQVDWNYFGVFEYGFTPYKISAGTIDWSYNGPVYFNGYSYYFVNGCNYHYGNNAIYVNHDSDYLITINRVQNCVIVYSKDWKGEFTVPYKAMICSVGAGENTPLGTFNTPEKYRWKILMGGVYGQYSTRVVGHVLLHSVPYLKEDNTTLEYWNYNKLGTPDSHGCIRLTTEDAKWIYENCPIGETVMIYDSYAKMPLARPTAMYIDPSDGRRGWDPTDPDPANPWNY